MKTLFIIGRIAVILMAIIALVITVRMFRTTFGSRGSGKGQHGSEEK